MVPCCRPIVRQRDLLDHLETKASAGDDRHRRADQPGLLPVKDWKRLHRDRHHLAAEPNSAAARSYSYASPALGVNFRF
jgi:hypothetical protein